MIPVYTNGAIYNGIPYAPPQEQLFRRDLARQQTAPMNPNYNYINYHEHSPLVNARIQEELYISSLSQRSTSSTLKYGDIQGSGYGSDKELMPKSIKIRPCSRPLIEGAGTQETPQGYQNPYMSSYNSMVGNVSPSHLQVGYTAQVNRYQHSNSMPIIDPIQFEPKNAAIKIEEKFSPKISEKKIVFDSTISSQHPTRDHLSPDPVRYAKMSEEDAAQAYEARKKALLDKLSKQTEKNAKASEESRKITNKRTPARAESKERGASRERSSGAINKNKTVLNSAPVPIKSLKAEIDYAQNRKDITHKELSSLKLSSDQEISSLPQSAFISPKSIDFDPPKNKVKNSSLTSKSQVQAHHNDKKIANISNTDAAPRVVSFSLNEKKENKVGKRKGHEESEEKEKVELKKIFTQEILGFKSHPVQSNVVEKVDRTYQADDEYSQRDNFRMSPSIRRTGNSNNISQDVNTRGSALGLEREYQAEKGKIDVNPLDLSRRAKTACLEEKLNLMPFQKATTGNSNDIKSKFIRRKRKASEGQEDQNNHSYPLPKDEEILPYTTLNEKGFESHHEYLYERSLLQKKNRDIAFQHKKMQNTERETEGCTFRPTIGSPPKLRESIIEKTRKWQAAKQQQIAESQAAAIERELMQCTFYPNNSLSNSENGHYNFKRFFERNKEWIQKKDEDNRKKEEELYSKMNPTPVRSSHVSNLTKNTLKHPSVKRSCCQEKEIQSPQALSNKLNKSPVLNKKTKSLERKQSHQTQSNNQIQSYNKGPVHTNHNDGDNNDFENPAERGTSVINQLDPIQETQQDLKTTLELATRPFDESTEDQQVKNEISQSFGIIKQLQHAVAQNEETTRPQESGKKRDLHLILKTIGEDFLRQCDSRENLNHNEPNEKNGTALKSKGDNVSPLKTQGSAFKEIPVTSLNYNSEIFHHNNFGVTLKNHKYYLSHKSPVTSEIKKQIEHTSTDLKVSDFLNEEEAATKGKSILVQRDSYHNSSAKKNKTVTIQPHLDQRKTSPAHFATRELDFSQASFRYVPNDVKTNNNNVYPILTKKYAEIMSKADNITRQLEQAVYGGN